jgi:hypothetical protein
MDSAHHKKQKPVSLIILICIVLLGVIATGIMLITSTAAPTSLTTIKKSCMYDEAICTYLTNFSQNSPLYTGPITATISVTQPEKGKGEVILQSDSHNNIYALLSQNGKTQGEILLIDNKLFKKNTQGNWQEQQNLENDTITQFRVKAFQQVNRSGKNITYTYIDTQPCGKYTCMQYQIETPTLGKTKEFIFFDTNDYVLRKIVQQTPDGLETQTTFAYTPVVVTPPVIH